MKNVYTLLFLFSSILVFSQEEDKVYTDQIYQDNIYTAYFDIEAGNMPVISMNGVLKFQFDDIDAGLKDYIFRIYHCDKDWKKSDIGEWDYLDGINEFNVEEYDLDDARYSDYTTYSFNVPNEDNPLLLSGNYILEVFDISEDEEQLAITRRFIVAENLLLVNINNKATLAHNYLNNQEVNFSINYGRFPMVSPKDEIYVSVLQNGNWGTMQNDFQPVSIQGDNLKFNLAKPITFPGLKEFRMFDIRGLKFASSRVESIDRHQDGTDVVLKNDRARYEYFPRDDMNGWFYIYESPYVTDGEEYVMVTFKLDAGAPYEDDVYVFGSISEWGLREKFKMTYNDELSLYYADVYLKQGVYDYMYALEKDGEIDLESIENSSGSALNDYNIIVYYRTLNTDYDRVVSYKLYKPLFKN